MKAATREWVQCAEADYDVACHLLRRCKRFSTKAICFHCQQCVEKYFKARLIEAGRLFPNTNDLEQLLNLLLPIEPLLAASQPALGALTAAYGIQFRHPCDLALKQNARNALQDCRAIRVEVRLSLGLPKK